MRYPLITYTSLPITMRYSVLLSVTLLPFPSRLCSHSQLRGQPGMHRVLDVASKGFISRLNSGEFPSEYPRTPPPSAGSPGFDNLCVLRIHNIKSVSAFHFFENQFNIPSRSIEFLNILSLQNFFCNVGEIDMILFITFIKNRCHPELFSIHSCLAFAIIIRSLE